MSNSFFGPIWAFIKTYKFAVVFTVLGIVLALLLINIGFWRTLLISLLAACGCGVGLFMDGRLRKRSDSSNPFKFD